MPRMVKYTLRLPETDRDIALRACRIIHGQSLNTWLYNQVRRLIADARRSRPEFALPVVELRPIDRTILLLLTTEGRRTDSDLAVETGMSTTAIRRSLQRLINAQLVYMLEQGGKTDEASGFRKKIYIAVNEQ